MLPGRSGVEQKFEPLAVGHTFNPVISPLFQEWHCSLKRRTENEDFLERRKENYNLRLIYLHEKGGGVSVLQKRNQRLSGKSDLVEALGQTVAEIVT